MKKLLIVILTAFLLTVSVAGADSEPCIYSAKRSGNTVDVRLNVPEGGFLCVCVYDASTRQMLDAQTTTVAAAQKAQTATVRFNRTVLDAELVKAFLLNQNRFVPLCEGMTGIIPVGQLNFTLNTNTMRFHYATCPSAKTISARNRKSYYGTRESVVAMGYEPCNNCRP